MTMEEVREHLKNHTLYVVERQTSRRGLPNVCSFFVIKNGFLERIDNTVVYLLGGASRLIAVGRIMAASIHDPYLHTLEDHLGVLSERLYGASDKLSYTII